MVVVGDDVREVVAGPEGALVFYLGGEPLDGPRFLDWNFVSSRPEAIRAAREAWREGRFPKVPGDSEEFIPLPE
jgi:redox-sensitive bicupin YhaK (pirin superfamily)